MFISQLPLDLEQYDRREQLKKSGLGKVGKHLLKKQSFYDTEISFSFFFGDEQIYI